MRALATLVVMIYVCACQSYSDATFKCAPFGIGNFNFWENIDCRNIERSVQCALDIATSTHTLDADSFRWLLQETPIYVFTVDAWYAGWPDNEEVGGLTYFTPPDGAYIELSKSGRGLLHELLHAWQAYHLDVTSYKHYKWEEKGYWDAAHAFENTCAHFDTR